MTRKAIFLPAIFLVGLLLISLWLFPPLWLEDLDIATDPETIAKGGYLVQAAGCVSCHMGEDDTSALIGGRALISEFGTFYVPNITPDLTTGIGNWSGKDLLAAIKHGRNPEGHYYFPAFPYRSYAGMTDEDALAIASWLMAQTPHQSTPPDHELPLPEWLARLAMGPWNRLADIKHPDFPDYEDEQVQRGAYLSRNLGHCGECHTPRDRFGIPDYSREFSGAPLLDGEAEAIDTDALEFWTEPDMAFFLLMGIKPDDEYVGGEMEAVIEHNTSPLTQSDRNAIAAFLKREQR